MSVPSIPNNVVPATDEVDAPPVPQDIEAEQGLLGACIVQPLAIEIVAEIVQLEQLYRPAHRAIYAAILDLFDRGEPSDMISLRRELERRGDFDRAGQGPYLHTLSAAAPMVVESSLRQWADAVRSAASARRVGELGDAFTAYAARRDVDADTVSALLDRAKDDVTEAADWLDADQGARQSSVGEHIPAALRAIDDRATNGMQSGILTGFAELDAVTNGLHAGQLIVVGARPGAGKSTLAVDMARSAAIQHGVPSLILSMEMSEAEITERVLSAQSRVRLGDLRSGQLARDDWHRLHESTESLTDAPLHYLDVSGSSITDLRAQARKMVRKHGIQLLVIDYLQLIESQGKAENRQIEVASFSRKLKLLAKELELPLVLVAQLNRGPEQRTDKKPQLSDLRESGGIENDADQVILIHRPDAYERDDPRMGEADLILAKHRAGPTTTVTVAHQLHYSRFVDMAPE